MTLRDSDICKLIGHDCSLEGIVLSCGGAARRSRTASHNQRERSDKAAYRSSKGQRDVAKRGNTKQSTKGQELHLRAPGGINAIVSAPPVAAS
jgi:hypothetical protein